MIPDHEDIPEDFGDDTAMEVVTDPMTGTEIAFGAWDPKLELEKFEQQAELMTKLVPATIKATKAQDWVKMGDKLYLQVTGVERISGLWGLIFGEPTIVRESHPDGTYTYIVAGPVGSRRTGVAYRRIEGGRWSGDGFFDRYPPKPRNWREMDDKAQAAWKKANRLDPNPLDVRKAALSNWMCRAASMLCGLRNLTSNDVIPLVGGEVKTVEFDRGAKGGKAKATNTEGAPVVPFGKNKGTAITELSDRSLDWYISKSNDNLQSAAMQQGGAKFKYRQAEEEWYVALLKEKEARSGPDAPPED